jgi:hypothetical protein
MIWLTWRQHRGAALVVGIALGLLAALLLVTGLSISATYQQLGVGNCLGASAMPHCTDIIQAFREETGFWRGFPFQLTFAPMLLAMLVGAPLIAREFEQGTHRLVWTQSAPRLRWLGWKLALIVGACLAVAAVETALVTWWRIPFAQLDGHLNPQEFDVEGIVPLAYMGYAVALAIAASALLRKTVPAMTVTVAGFIVVRFPILLLARRYYLPPITAIWDPFLQTPALKPARGDWVFDGSWIDATGRAISDTRVVGHLLNRCESHQLESGHGIHPMHTPAWVARPGGVAAGGSVLALPGHRERHLPRPGRAPAATGHLLGEAKAQLTRSLSDRQALILPGRTRRGCSGDARPTGPPAHVRA